MILHSISSSDVGAPLWVNARLVVRNTLEWVFGNARTVASKYAAFAASIFSLF
jgi:hypothetical protein